MRALLGNPWTLSVLIVLLLAGWMLSGQLASAPDADGAAAGAAANGAVGAAGAANERGSRLTTVQYRDQLSERVERRLSLSGRTAPARTVSVKAQTAGRVDETVAERGARLDEGDVVLRLEMADRQARLAAARALVRQRELEYEAERALEPEGYNSQARVAEALAQLEAARAELTRAQLDLERREVRAPFDGALQERSVEPGDYVTPGDPLFTFLDDRTVIVAGDVSENDIDFLAVGMPASATLVDGTHHAGRIRYIAPLADQTTRTFAIELALDNPDERVPLGASAELVLALETVRAHPVSPALLALDDAGALGVKVIDADNRVRFHHVQVVRAEPDTVWVSGLPEQVRIVTVGAGFVGDGERVAPQPESASTRTAAAPVRSGGDRAGGGDRAASEGEGPAVREERQ